MAEEAQVEAHLPAQQPQAGQAARLPRPHADPCGPGDPAGPAAEGSRPPLRLIGRVGDRATFDALRRDGRRARRGPMTVTHLPDTGSGVRVAYAVGRRVGPAVVRNRVRRRLRAAVREIDRSGPGLAEGAYLIAVRPEAADRTYRELRDDLAGACAAATGSQG